MWFHRSHQGQAKFACLARVKVPVPISVPFSDHVPDTKPHRLMVPVKVLVPWTEPDGYVKLNVTWFRLIVPNTGPEVPAGR